VACIIFVTKLRAMLANFQFKIFYSYILSKNLKTEIYKTNFTHCFIWAWYLLPGKIPLGWPRCR